MNPPFSGPAVNVVPLTASTQAPVISQEAPVVGKGPSCRTAIICAAPLAGFKGHPDLTPRTQITEKSTGKQYVVTAFSALFDKEIRVYSAAGDTKTRPLYQSILLSEKQGCSRNFLATFLYKRRNHLDGIFQSSGFEFVLEAEAALGEVSREKVRKGTYYLTLGMCKYFFNHITSKGANKEAATEASSVGSHTNSEASCAPTSPGPNGLNGASGEGKRKAVQELQLLDLASEAAKEDGRSKKKGGSPRGRRKQVKPSS